MTQVTYRIDEIQGGGFYLVEQIPAKAGDPAARPTEYPQKFADTAQIKGYVAYLRKQAADLKEQARLATERAPVYESAAEQIEATTKAYFAPKPPPVVVVPDPPKPTPTPKPKPKKKKKGL